MTNPPLKFRKYPLSLNSVDAEHLMSRKFAPEEIASPLHVRRGSEGEAAGEAVAATPAFLSVVSAPANKAAGAVKNAKGEVTK